MPFFGVNFRYKLIVVFTVWFGPGISFAQVCPCGIILDSLILHLEVNYPGFGNGIDKMQWQGWCASHKSAVQKVYKPGECSAQLNQFLQFFNDGHLQVVYKGDVYKSEKHNSTAPAWPELTETKARRYLDSTSKTDSLEGIWESYEDLYKIFIKKHSKSGNYSGYILETINQNWQRGEIKMEFSRVKDSSLQLHYFMSSHKKERHVFTLNHNILNVRNRTVFQKVYPKPSDALSLESFVSENFGTSETFIQWNRNTFYIQLQNISAGNKPLIDSLLRINRSAIDSSRYLILDLRDNEGGDFTCFENFWPYIQGDTILIYGTTYRCTPKNVEAYKRLITQLESGIIDEFSAFANELELHTGKDWRVDNDTIVAEKNRTKPEKVILLVNRKCKSSTENFVLAAMRSPKVIVAGETTGGVLDFEEVVDFALAYPHMVLQMPIGYSNRLPYYPLNGKGIEPQIKLKSGSKAWQPWVRQVLRKLE